jgi:hypothetical protein
LRSWPAQNARPAPVSTTARTPRSRDTAVNAASSSRFIGIVSALSASGRSSVIVAIASATS